MIETRYVTQKNMHSIAPVEYKEGFGNISVMDILKFISKRHNDDTLMVSNATLDEINLLANILHKEGWNQCNKGPLLSSGIRFAKVAVGLPTAGYYDKRYTPEVHDVLCDVIGISKVSGNWGPFEITVNTIYVKRHQFPVFNK